MLNWGNLNQNLSWNVQSTTFFPTGDSNFLYSIWLWELNLWNSFEMSEQPMSKNKIYSHESLTARGYGEAEPQILLPCSVIHWTLSILESVLRGNRQVLFILSSSQSSFSQTHMILLLISNVQFWSDQPCKNTKLDGRWKADDASKLLKAKLHNCSILIQSDLEATFTLKLQSCFKNLKCYSTNV